MTARPIRRNAQTPDRNGKIFYTSTTSLSHISKMCRDEVKAEVKAEVRAEVMAEVMAEARKELEGEVKAEVRKELEGEQQLKLVNIIIKKVKKDKSLTTIASDLEEDVADIRPIYEAVMEAAPDYDEKAIIKKLNTLNN